jgi:hypothetical protein
MRSLPSSALCQAPAPAPTSPAMPKTWTPLAPPSSGRPCRPPRPFSCPCNRLGLLLSRSSSTVTGRPGQWLTGSPALAPAAALQYPGSAAALAPRRRSKPAGAPAPVCAFGWPGRGPATSGMGTFRTDKACGSCSRSSIGNGSSSLRLTGAPRRVSTCATRATGTSPDSIACRAIPRPWWSTAHREAPAASSMSTIGMHCAPCHDIRANRLFTLRRPPAPTALRLL